jgi:hypothetical protein
MKKIDVFNHIWPKPFHDALIAHVGETTDITRRSEAVPMMTNLDRRFEVMDMFGDDYCQILSLASPPFEKYADPAKSLDLARIGSDSMAELCQKYPDRDGRRSPPQHRRSRCVRHADFYQRRR